MRKIEAAQEMLRRPVRLGFAMKISFAMIALGAGLAAANAMTIDKSPAKLTVESKASIKPIILSIDWQERDMGATKLAAISQSRL